eukprot:jgi/Tetstr1/427374/TSEL_017538.t1
MAAPGAAPSARAPSSRRDLELAARLDDAGAAQAGADMFLVPAPPPPPDMATSTSSGSSSPDPRQLGAPAMFFCPISHQLFRDPVLLPTGQTYERRNISRWLKGGNLKCPVTGQMLMPPVALVPNVALRQSVEEWCERNLPQLLDVNGRLLPLDPEDVDESLDVSKIGLRLDAPQAGGPRDLESQRSSQSPYELSHQRASYMHNFPIGRRTRTLALDEEAPPPTPWFLYIMSIVLVTVMIAEIGVNGWQFAPLDVNPLIGPDVDTLILMGAKVTHLIVYESEWWRIFSSIFLSAGLIQVLGSLSAMWTFGRYLEREITSVTIASIFLISAIGGVLVSANMAPDAITVGSSGGVFGLLGATWVEHLIDWKRYKHHVVTILNLIIITAINFFIGLLPFVDNWCNLGGFAVGALLCCTVLLTRRHAQNKCTEMGLLAAQICCGLMVLLIFAVFVMALVLNLQIGAECEWCHYFTCIPTSWWVCDDIVTDQDACYIELHQNGTLELQCPNGEVAWVPAPAVPNEENYVRLCQQQCGLGKQSDAGVIE